MKRIIRLFALILTLSICFGAIAFTGYAQGDAVGDMPDSSQRVAAPNEATHLLGALMTVLQSKSSGFIMNDESGETDIMWLHVRYLIINKLYTEGYAGVSDYVDAFSSEKQAIRYIRERQKNAYAEKLVNSYGSLMVNGLEFAEQVRRAKSLMSLAEDFGDLVSDSENYQFIITSAEKYISSLQKENAALFDATVSAELKKFCDGVDELYENPENMAQSIEGLRKLYYNSGLGEGAGEDTHKKYAELEAMAYADATAEIVFKQLTAPLASLSDDPDKLYTRLAYSHFMLQRIDTDADELLQSVALFEETKAEYESKYLSRNKESGTAYSIAVSIPTEYGLLPSAKHE